MTELVSGKAKKLVVNNEGPGTSRNSQPGSIIFLNINTTLISSGTDIIRIRDLYDPDNRYAGLGHLRETKVECPEVRDGDGVVIHPRDYWYKLRQATFVKVDIYLKL